MLTDQSRRVLLRHPNAVDVQFEQVIDADAVDAVGLRQRPSLRLRVHHDPVDHEVDLAGVDAHFEGVGGFSGVIRFLNRVVGRICSDESEVDPSLF